MLDNWKCRMCGSRAYQFNPRSMRLACSECRSPISTAEEMKAKVQLEKTLAFAKQHLHVGNYSECRNLVLPLLDQYPADKRVYLMLLACSTKGYTDLHITDDEIRCEAAEYWDKLERLRCVNNAMIDYARRIRKRTNDETSKKRRKHIAALLCTCFLLLIFIAAGQPFLIVCGFIATSIVLWRIGKVVFTSLFKEPTRNSTYSNSNPFL